MWVKGTLQSITHCSFRACSSVCECVCVCMSACRSRSQKLVAWLCSTLALALLCSALRSALLSAAAGWLAFFAFLFFACLPPPPLPLPAFCHRCLPHAACRMPPAAVSWHVVLALSLGFGLAGWHAGCSQPAVAVATLATLRRQQQWQRWRRFALCSAEFSISVVS